MMGKLGSDAVANVIGQATSTGNLDDMFEKLDPATLATTVSTMVMGSAGAAAGAMGSLTAPGAGLGSGITGLTAAGSMVEVPKPWGGFGGNRLRDIGIASTQVLEDRKVDSELDKMKEFIDDLELTDEQQEAYYELFPDEAPTDAERIEELEEQLEDLQDKLEDVLGEESVGDGADATDGPDGDDGDLDDLGLDTDIDTDDGDIGIGDDLDDSDGMGDADGLGDADDLGDTDGGGGLDPVDDVGDAIGDFDEPVMDEPEPVAEPEPEPVVDSYDQQMSAADSVESSVDDMFDGG